MVLRPLVCTCEWRFYGQVVDGGVTQGLVLGENGEGEENGIRVWDKPGPIMSFS